MNSKRLAVLVCGTGLMLVGAIALPKLSNREMPATASRNTIEKSAQQSTVVALTQQIAQVEVEKLLKGEVFIQSAPQMAQLKEQQFNLEQRLAQLQPENHQNLVTEAIARAVESKLADLEVQHAQDQAKFIDTAPQLQLQKDQIAALRQRLTTLQ